MQALAITARMAVALVALVALIVVVRNAGDAITTMPLSGSQSLRWWLEGARLLLIASLPPAALIAALWPRLWWLPVMLALLLMIEMVYADPQLRLRIRDMLGF